MKLLFVGRHKEEGTTKKGLINSTKIRRSANFDSLHITSSVRILF